MADRPNRVGTLAQRLSEPFLSEAGMLRSRTVKTLFVLFVAMLAGAMALLAMQTDPLLPPSGHLAALARSDGQDVATLVHQTNVPLQPIQWRNIVIHSAKCLNRDGRASEVHFRVLASADDEVSIQPMQLWKQQTAGSHLPLIAGRDLNADSIGVCLAGDLAGGEPSAKQMARLTALVRALQQACRIPADHVYLHSDLDSHTGCPGRSFPAERFSAELIHATR